MRYASELVQLFLQPSSSKCFSSFGFCFLSCITKTWVGFEKEVAKQFLFAKKTESQVPVPTDFFKFLPAARLSHQPTSKSRLKLFLKAAQKTRQWFKRTPSSQTCKQPSKLQAACLPSNQDPQCYPIIPPSLMVLYPPCPNCWTQPLWLPHLHSDRGNRSCPATGSRWQPVSVGIISSMSEWTHPICRCLVTISAGSFGAPLYVWFFMDISYGEIRWVQDIIPG